ncbi:unnamed protein product [Heterobilharzia americana]|nr:unnamed protein product [Heterobilharzia americana]
MKVDLFNFHCKCVFFLLFFEINRKVTIELKIQSKTCYHFDQTFKLITLNNNAHNLAIKCQFKNIYQNTADKYENVRVYKFYLVTSQLTNSEGNISSLATSIEHSTTTANDNGFKTVSTNNDSLFDNFTNWVKHFLMQLKKRFLKG